MRTRLLLLVISGALVSFGFGCSGDDTSGDAGNDATSDGPSAVDASPDVGSPSDAASDAPSADASDGAIALDITCTSPADCDGGAPTCCGAIALNGGTAPACAISSIATACKTAAACATMLPFDCSGSDTVRFCNKPSDCTEPSYGDCCTFQVGDQSATFCANSTIAGSVDASCMTPP